MKVYVVITASHNDCQMYLMLNDTVTVFKTRGSAQAHYDQELNKVKGVTLMKDDNTQASSEDKKFFVDSAPIELIERDLLH